MKIENFLFFILCITSLNISTFYCKEKADKKRLVIVYLHGTLGVFGYLNFKWIMKHFYQIPFIIFGLKFEKRYKCSSDFCAELKDKRWLNLYSGIVPIVQGLTKLYSFDKEKNEALIENESVISGDGWAIIHSFIDNWMENKIANNYDNVDFYAFGWSGLPLVSERAEASKDFYNKFIDLQERYNNSKEEVQYCIIAFSHGGTVALGLGNVEKNESSRSLHPIEYLILLGVPIFKENEELMVFLKKDGTFLFKNVVLILSKKDRVQGSDLTIRGTFKTKKKLSTSMSKYNHIYQGYASYQIKKNPKNGVLHWVKDKFSVKSEYPNHGELARIVTKKESVIPHIPIFVFIPYILEKLMTHLLKKDFSLVVCNNCMKKVDIF